MTPGRKVEVQVQVEVEVEAEVRCLPVEDVLTGELPVHVDPACHLQEPLPGGEVVWEASLGHPH